MTEQNKDQDVKLEEFLKAWFKEDILCAYPRPELDMDNLTERLMNISRDDLDRAYAQAAESVELRKAQEKVAGTLALFDKIEALEKEIAELKKEKK